MLNLVRSGSNLLHHFISGGLVQHYKQGGKSATASPISCIAINDTDGNVHGSLKGNDAHATKVECPVKLITWLTQVDADNILKAAHSLILPLCVISCV